MMFITYSQMVQRKCKHGQDGDIGRHALPPHTTISRITTNLKTKTNQNCQKIELYGSPTAKDLKKKCSSRKVGRAETGSCSREDTPCQWPCSGSYRNRKSHIHVWQTKTRRNTWGASNPSPRPDCAAQGSNKETLGHLQKCQHPNRRDARRKRERARNGQLI